MARSLKVVAVALCVAGCNYRQPPWEPPYPPDRQHIWLACSPDGVAFKRVEVMEGPRDIGHARKYPGCNVLRLEVGP